MEAYFVVAHIEGGTKKFKLCGGEYVTIGRSEKSCQVVLDDPMCSSKHCKISMAHNIIYVEDLNSKNGIFLNGVRIIKQNLYIGDKLKVGGSILYILESKLTERDKKFLTYEGGGLRKSGDLTFEVDSPNKGQIDLGRRRDKMTVDTGEPLVGRRKRVPINFVPSRNVSKTKVMILDLAAFLIDLGTSFFIFILGVKSLSIFFPEKYNVLSSNNSFTKLMLSEEFNTYTLIIFVIVIIFFMFNRRMPTGSIGERILKVR